MSVSDTTPMTLPASLTTGNPLTWERPSIAAICLNDVSSRTAITPVVMTSLTVALIGTASLLRALSSYAYYI